jgi:hypothetical protein
VTVLSAAYDELRADGFGHRRACRELGYRYFLDEETILRSLKRALSSTSTPPAAGQRQATSVGGRARVPQERG